MRDSLTLYAMTEKGLEVLRVLLERSPDLVSGVVSARDKGNERDGFDEIRALCSDHGVAFADRRDARAPRGLVLAVSWRWLIPSERATVIVFHDSLLPRLRGFNPLVTALIRGDREIGVTALLATEDYDRGDVLDQEARAIDYPITIQEAINRTLGCYRALAIRLADRISSSAPLKGTPQDDSAASYSLWRDEEDYRIDWSRSAGELRRFVDAVGSPYAGACARMNDEVVRVLGAEGREDVEIENRAPGKVIFVEKGCPVVVCGSGLLRLTDVVYEDGTSALPLTRFRTRFS